MSDEDLLERIAAGDRQAFAEFYDRHAAHVLGVVHRWTESHSDAEEVLQETFWQVWRQADRFDRTRASARGWLFLLARSRALDLLRRRERIVHGEAAMSAATNEDFLGNLEREETNQKLSRAFRALPEAQRSALQLAFYGGLTYEQVALQQSIPLGTAKTRIRAAIHRLRRQLADSREPQT